ncbi:MAG: FAD-dependent oxidoreductase [Nitrospiraceae bacterium]|nr:FAD-dependent oxidoreductase [Nitrospiraceae bacterium]
MAEDILTPEAAETLREAFKGLVEDVTLHVFTKSGMNEKFSNALVNLVQSVSAIDKRIKAHFHSADDDSARRYAVERYPTLLISPEKYGIRYTGSPIGEEGRSFIMAILMASTGRGFLTPESIKRVSKLNERRAVRIFVSPTCPYCPQEAAYGIAAAVEKPGLVTVDIVETYENLDLAERYAAMSVPKTYINDELTASYLETENEFVSSLLAGQVAEKAAAGGPSEAPEKEVIDVLIAGAGPAGLTAAIYAGRSGLKSIVLERGNVGGQVTITPVVENYPGFQAVPGRTLVDMMLRQAAQYSRIRQGVEVQDVRRTDGLFEVLTNSGVFIAKAVIIASGSIYRKLGVPGEDRFAGRGISYCATCDGYLFKDGKTVIVVGGGNTALTDALYLDGLGAHVTLIHAKKSLRAEDRLKQSFFQRDLPTLWESRVAEFMGGAKLEKIRVESIKDNAIKEMKVDGAFIAIGYEPSSGLAKTMGLELDTAGYIKVDEKMRTSVPMVYAAGDITGAEKQITVAVSQGTLAAISAFNDLTGGATL